jgi:hypothetical protein
MPVSVNPYRNRVKLDVEKLAVIVEVLKKDDESVVETGTFEASQLPDNLRPHVALYGLSKLLQDRTSEVETGPGKIAAMNELMEQFRQGVWTAERKSGSPTVSAEVEALAAIKGLTVAEAQAALRKYDKPVRDKILSNEKIVAKAEEIRKARKTAEGIDLEDLATAA